MAKIKSVFHKIRESKPFIFYISITRNFPLVICLHRIKDSIIFDSVFGFLLLPFSLLFLSFVRVRYLVSKKSYKIVGVVIAKNESAYIEELVDYYRLIGFDKLYVFDNDSSDNMRQLLEPYKKNDFVIYNTIKGRGRQRDVYNIFLNKYGHKTEYATFFDCDEFLKTPFDSVYETIDSCFKSLNNNAGALGINWVIFGTSGLVNKPEKGGVIDNYLYRMPYNSALNMHLKFIAKPNCILSIRNPHYPYLWIKKMYYNQNGDKLNGAFDSFHNEKNIMFYHYYTKSRSEYYARINKGNAFTGDKTKRLENLEIIDKDAIYDNSLKKYVDERRKSYE